MIYIYKGLLGSKFLVVPGGAPCPGELRCILSIPTDATSFSGSDDFTIRIWDAETGAVVGKPLEGHTGEVHSVAYSPNKRHIISGSDDCTIRIWNAGTGRVVDCWPSTFRPNYRGLPTAAPDSVFQIRIVLSADPEMIWRPSGGVCNGGHPASVPL